MKNLLTLFPILILFLSSCGNQGELNPKDAVDHWEISRTLKTYTNSTLDIDTLKHEYQISSGRNQVLIVEIEKKPVFKVGKELTDLYSAQTLLIELDSADSSVSAMTPLNSRFYKKLIAFSPDHGIRPMDKSEKIVLIRQSPTVWKIDSHFPDFVFNAELDFSTNQVLTNNYLDY